LAPVIKLIEESANNIPGDSDRFTLSFAPFAINLLFGIIKQIKSVSLLVTEIESSDDAKAFGLVHASKSMYSEAFARYDPELFRAIFYQLVTTISFLCIPELKHLGQVLLVDGSLFPAISSMQWASYKSTANAIKMHLAYDLNKMIPVQFLVKEGNYSEKKFLKDILEKGITYVCDRGYISFRIFRDICNKGAFFVIRGKNKMRYLVHEELVVDIPANFLIFISNIKDIKVVFDNDNDNYVYRIVKFVALGEQYVLVTNRFDLTTYQVIMLYAYRWQIELFFRFIKRTLKGIHLLSHDPNGIQVQFYLYIIAYLLLLAFKQECEQINDEHKVNTECERTSTISNIQNDSNNGVKITSGRIYVRGLVSMLGEGLKKYWKIGLHWLTVLRKCLSKTFDVSIALTLASYK
jgi:hypothetical protein